MKATFLMIDGNSLLHRAFHALPLMDAGGIYTNAIYGFLTMMLKAISDENARYLAVCFDEHAPTFRHTAYPDYKAGRAATPDELRQQFATIRTLLPEMGIQVFSLQGWEADDLLGTLSKLGEDAGVSPVILTGDRDALQLVSDTTQVLFTRKGISETTHFTPAMVYEVYGFSPEQVVDWKGLAGDSSDNIPGIPGVGDKTAVRLLHQYGTLDNILAHAGEVKGKLGEKLVTWANQAKMCRELATIRRDAPIAFSLKACAMPDFRHGIPALEKLKLNSIIRRLQAPDDAPAPDTAADETPLTLLPFADAAPISSGADLTAWLTALPDSARPIAVALDDTVLTCAAQDLSCCQAALGGDLLTPGADPEDLLRALAPDLAAHPAVIHDGKTLWHRLNRAKLPMPERYAWDVQLGAYLLDPQRKSYSLDALCGDLPADARGMLSLCRWQQANIDRMGMSHLMRDVEMPLSGVLYRMEDIGFTVDTAFLRQLGERYTQEIEQSKQQVFAACGTTFNLNSTQQLGDVLFDKLQLPHGKKTARGYSTSAEVLEGLQDIAPEVITPLLRYRQLTKLNSTYVEGLLRLTDATGRVHSTFDQVATATGRISSSEPNLQNIPIRTELGSRLRGYFVAAPGETLVDADYSQIELRILAHITGDEAMQQAFLSGADIHRATAAKIYHIPESDVTHELRTSAKAINFGIMYGKGAFSLGKDLGISVKEADTFLKTYLNTFPKVDGYMQNCIEHAKEKGYVETLFGRRRPLPELASSNFQVRRSGERMARNTPIQGTAADIIKLAMVHVWQRLRDEKLQARLLLQVHDELIVEAPENEVEQVKRILKEEMEQVVSYSVPLTAEVGTGKTWLEAH